MPRKPRKSKLVEAGLVAPQGGRPSKVHDLDALDLICKTIALGTHLETACYLADIRPETVKDYCYRARQDPEGPYGIWLKQITAALARAELRDLAVIDTAAQGRPAQFLMVPKVTPDGQPIYNAKGEPVMEAQLDGEGRPIKTRAEVFPSWQAAAWKLERKAPKRWGRYDRIAIDDLEGFRENTGPETEEDKISKGEIRARAKRLIRVKKVLEAVPDDTDLGDV